ncbi:MAG: hypothetical protein EOO52_03575 [Gammaproteobacteria bacterium]|nr:MAG: hypothetical protein EOO52_03575 [Gammaproteobacteria bacterium]
MVKSVVFILSIFSLSALSFAQLNGGAGDGGAVRDAFPETNRAVYDHLEEVERALNEARRKSAKAHPKFGALFDQAQKAIMKDDLIETERLLTKLHEIEDLNAYENSRIYLLEYWYNGKLGNKELEYEAASKLMAVGAGNIDSHAYVEAGMRLLKHQYNNQDLGGAIETLNNLRKDSESQVELMSIVSAVKKLDEFSEQQTDIVQKITINDTGMWSAKIFKPQFYLSAVNGEVSTLGFNCTNKQATLNYKPDSVMEIPEAWGSCTMKVNAKPNTTFNFVQTQKKAA